MKHLFVPYEIALLAKQKNFNEPVIALYDEFIEIDQERVLMSAVNEMGILTGIKSLSVAYSIGVPSYQQLLDWFREKHKQFIVIMPKATPSNSVVYYQYEGVQKRNWENCYEDYYEALNKALEEAFKLI